MNISGLGYVKTTKGHFLILRLFASYFRNLTIFIHPANPKGATKKVQLTL